MQQPIGRPRAMSTACSRDRELFASKVTTNPMDEIFPIASSDSNRNTSDELFEALPITVGEGDNQVLVFDAILGIVVTVTVEGDGAIVALDSSDSGASDG